MAKTCKHETCNFPVWGGGYCKYHQKERTDKKLKPLKKSRSKTEEEREDRQRQAEKDHEFYTQIWEERPHICYNCEGVLKGEPLTIYFDHILEKSKYPKLRYVASNICLLCWDCHSNKSNGILSDKLKHLRIETMKKLLLDGTEPTI